MKKICIGLITAAMVLTFASTGATAAHHSWVAEKVCGGAQAGYTCLKVCLASMDNRPCGSSNPAPCYGTGSCPYGGSNFALCYGTGSCPYNGSNPAPCYDTDSRPCGGNPAPHCGAGAGGRFGPRSGKGRACHGKRFY